MIAFPPGGYVKILPSWWRSELLGSLDPYSVHPRKPAAAAAAGFAQSQTLCLTPTHF